MQKERPTAVEILTAARDHVAKYGPTGGNSLYTPYGRVCPRGLVRHFAGEHLRGAVQQPKKAEARRALEALDDVAIDAGSPGTRLGSMGRFAEKHCNILAPRPNANTEGAEYFQRAIERVS